MNPIRVANPETVRTLIWCPRQYRQTGCGGCVSAYLNEGAEPRRLPFGAHSYYVPAQLFPTAEGYLALFVTHDGFWKSYAAEAGIAGFLTMAERTARREEVLAAVTQALAADTAMAWVSRLRRLGVPAAAVRTLPEALADAAGGAGGRCRRRWRPPRT